mgnify:CR=1 FL=1
MPSGKNLAANVAFEQFNKQLKPVGRQPAAKMVKALQSFIHPLIGKAQELAKGRLMDVQQQAQAVMQQSLNAQIERLQALQKLNPSVRTEEIVHLQQQQQAVTEYWLAMQADVAIRQPQ